jgi:hypothetical protein
MNASARLAVVAATLLAALPAAAGPSKAAGSWWEVTFEAKGTGQAKRQPPQIEKQCLPVEFTIPPAKDGDCELSDVKRSGGRVTWKMVCQDVRGEGELVRSGDTFTVNAVYRGPQGEVRWVSHGKKLGGSCDPDEKDRTEAALAAYEKRGLHGEDQICGNAVEELDPTPFTGDAVICKDPQMKADFCESAQSMDGLRQLLEPGKDAQRKAALAFCGEDEAKLRGRHCASAMKLASDQDAIFAVAACPEAAPLAKKECKDRDYTYAAKPYKNFCAAWQNRHANAQR